MKEFYDLIERCLTKFDRLIFKRLTLIHVYLLSLIYILVVNGLGNISNDAPYLISKNPFINVLSDSPDIAFHYDSIIVPLIGYFSGLNTSIIIYSLLNLFIVLLANVLFIYISRKKFGSDIAKIVAILFLLNPISTILFTWIGSYDSATYLLQTLLFFSANVPIIFVLSFLGGLNHFPVMLISGASLLLFRAANKKDRVKYTHLLPFLVGLVTGLIALKAYQNYFELGIDIDRFNFLKTVGLKYLIFDIWLSNWLALLFSLYNVLWGIVILIMYFLQRNYQRLFYIFIGSNLCFLFLTGLAIDSTRVFALLSWPLLFYSFLFIVSRARLENETFYLGLRKYLSGITLVGLFIPRIYVWTGNVHFSALKDSLTLIDKLIQTIVQ